MRTENTKKTCFVSLATAVDYIISLSVVQQNLNGDVMYRLTQPGPPGKVAVETNREEYLNAHKDTMQ